MSVVGRLFAVAFNASYGCCLSADAHIHVYANTPFPIYYSPHLYAPEMRTMYQNSIAKGGVSGLQYNAAF